MFTRKEGFSRPAGRVFVMGILNVTPDSFSDGGSYATIREAVTAAARMQAQGADCIDIGGQSTRPGSTPVSREEEWTRIAPVLEAVRSVLQVPISVDTFYPSVAERALAAGADIINDVSGTVDEAMARLLRQTQAGWILMHTCAEGTLYDPVSEVRAWFSLAGRTAMAVGVSASHLCLDPGIGFGKTNEQSLALLTHTDRLRSPSFAYLVGCSRKRCIGEPAGSLLPRERDSGTVAANTIAVLGGANIIRVHDVAGAVQAARVTEALMRQREEF